MLQEAIASLVDADAVTRGRVTVILQTLADTDPFQVNREVARKTIESIRKGLYE